MNNESKKKIGRPPSKNPAIKTLPLIRVTPEKLIIYKKAAKSKEMTFAAFARDALDKACED